MWPNHYAYITVNPLTFYCGFVIQNFVFFFNLVFKCFFFVRLHFFWVKFKNNWITSVELNANEEWHYFFSMHYKNTIIILKAQPMHLTKQMLYWQYHSSLTLSLFEFSKKVFLGNNFLLDVFFFEKTNIQTWVKQLASSLIEYEC